MHFIAFVEHEVGYVNLVVVTLLVEGVYTAGFQVPTSIQASNATSASDAPRDQPVTCSN